MASPQNRQAFTFLQVLLSLVVVICLGIILSQPVRRHYEVRRCEAYIKDMATFSAAFRAASRNLSAVPKSNDDLLGIPKGMEAQLKDGSWLKPSPLGGNYIWINSDPLRVTATTAGSEPESILGKIGISAFPPSPPFKLNARELEYLKSRFEAHAVPGVSFQIGFNGWPLCMVHPTP